MESTIQNLIKAQEIQKNINQLEKEIQLMPLKREEIANKIDKTKKNINVSLQEIAEIEKEIENLTISIQEKKKEIESLDEDENTNTSSRNEKEEKRKDFVLQIDNYKKKIEDLEEQKHKKAKAIKSDEASLEGLKKDLIEEDEYISKNKEKKVIELENLKREKNETLSNVNDEIIEKFDRIFQNKGDLAIVPVYKNYCSGCNMILPFSLINRVRAQKEIIFCPYCSRMLYYSEEEVL